MAFSRLCRLTKSFREMKIIKPDRWTKMLANSGRYSIAENFLKLFIGLLVSAGLLVMIAASANAAPAFSAIAIDARSGKILFARNIDSRRYPASMTKMMTLYLLFEDLKSRRITMNTRLRVSRYASSRPPSKLGFRPGQTIRVRDAIKALVTKSANDVATAIAENLGGTESGFARRMTSTARRIGMTRTTFRNASGLPNRSQLTTARDMATLGLRLQRDFPKYYKYFAIKRFSYRGRRYGNHNRLLGRIKGVDGIKTGYTRASGFNLTSSARRGKKRVIAVVMGGRTGGSRNRYMAALIKRMFARERLVSSTRLARVAGNPPGYVRTARRVRVAKAKTVRKPAFRSIPLPRNKPGRKLQKPIVVAAKKQQDRIKAQKPVVLKSSTFRTATIIDSNAPDEIIQDEGSSSVVSKGKGDLAIARPVRIKPEVKVAQQKMPETQPVQQTANLHNDSWNIQIGAFPSKEGADGKLVKAVSKARRSLKGKTAFTIEVRKGGSKFYRARFAGFNRKTARRACRALAKKGVSCFALAPRS
jgi:D-alanyl-D-alanine carboxypeptidase